MDLHSATPEASLLSAGAAPRTLLYRSMMTAGQPEAQPSFLERYQADLEKVAEPLILRDPAKVRASLTELLAKLAGENAVAGLSALGFGVAGGGIAGAAAGLAVKLVMAKFEHWLKANDATANFSKAVQDTQSEFDRYLLLRDIRLWLGPTLESIAAELVQQREALGEQSEAKQNLVDALLRRLPDAPVDSLVGILRARTLSLPRRLDERSPAQLLDARYCVVPFDEASRADELDLLRSFLHGEGRDTFALRVFIGPGGAGKTRLLMHFCEELWSRHEQHWHAGFLHEDQHDAALTALARPGYPALVVLDYAEGRRDLRAWLKKLLESDRARSKLRIVLLARHAEDWWTNLAQGDAALEHLLREPVVRLHDVSYGDGDRARLYESALAAYAEALGRSVPVSGSPALSEPQYARPLYMHMAALFQLLEPSSAPAHDPGRLPWKVVQREARMWGVAQTSTPWPEIRVMAAVTLLGGADLGQLESLEAAACHARDEAFVRELMAYYPHDNGVGALEPDLIGEALVYQVLSEKLTPRDYLDQALATASAKQLQQALTILGRIATAHPADGRTWIERVLNRDTLQRARPAFDAALAVTEQRIDDVLGQALARALQAHNDLELAREWELRLPTHTTSLREVKVWVRRQLMAVANSDEERSRCSLNLGTSLRDVGDREGALQAARDATDTYRKLAAARPNAFLPKLASSLNNLGVALAEVGDREGAAQVAREATETCRELVATRPDTFFPALAMNLSNLGNRLSELGDREGALQAAREATDIRRKLAAKRPDAFARDLAASLNNLGIILSEVGNREGALKATQEATDIYRKLSKARPDAFLPDFAASLSNLANRLADVGDRDGALRAARDATNIRRGLATTRPEAFLSDLAQSLNNLGIRLSELGDHMSALQTAREATDIRRKLAAKRPDAFVPDLASSLDNLGIMLSKVADHEGALEAAREATNIYRELASARPDAFLHHLSGSLDNLGIMLSKVGDHQDALEATREATDICRKLAATRPDAFLPRLAASVNNLGIRLSELGDHKGAAQTTREAAELRRKLAEAQPDVFLPDLATSLNNLGVVLSKMDDREGALQAAREAADTYRTLAVVRPDPFLPDLATSLNNLGVVLSKMDDREGARASVAEAVSILRELVVRRPHLQAALQTSARLLEILDRTP